MGADGHRTADGVEDTPHSLLHKAIVEHPPVAESLDTVERMGGVRFALQDYPCEPALVAESDRAVADQQARMTDRAIRCLDAAQDRGVAAEPIAVIQGWTVDDYLAHLDDLRDHGLLTATVGIGSVCRPHATAEVARIITAVRDALPARYAVHAFGVKLQALQQSAVQNALVSVDTTAWSYAYDPYDVDARWQEMTYDYLDYRRRLAATLERDGTGSTQSPLDRYMRDS